MGCEADAPGPASQTVASSRVTMTMFGPNCRSRANPSASTKNAIDSSTSETMYLMATGTGGGSNGV
jgi:hypothetical protein